MAYRDIPGFPAYLVGDDGSVWSCWMPGCRPRHGESWHRLKPSRITKRGYLQVHLHRGDGVKHYRRVHILVLEAFVGPRPEGMDGCHNDGKPANNHVSNLRWDTRSNNILDSVRHGTHPLLAHNVRQRALTQGV